MLVSNFLQNLGQLEARTHAVVALHATSTGKVNHRASREHVQSQLSLC